MRGRRHGGVREEEGRKRERKDEGRTRRAKEREGGGERE